MVPLMRMFTCIASKYNLCYVTTEVCTTVSTVRTSKYLKQCSQFIKKIFLHKPKWNMFLVCMSETLLSSMSCVKLIWYLIYPISLHDLIMYEFQCTLFQIDNMLGFFSTFLLNREFWVLLGKYIAKICSERSICIHFKSMYNIQERGSY